MNNKQLYNKIINDVFQLNDAEIDENMTRENVEVWDSILHITLITAIEDEFEIMLDTEDILNLHSYKDGLDIISKYNSKG